MNYKYSIVKRKSRKLSYHTIIYEIKPIQFIIVKNKVTALS